MLSGAKAEMALMVETVIMDLQVTVVLMQLDTAVVQMEGVVVQVVMEEMGQVELMGALVAQWS
jgi:hypothetical protein